ncbi:uncharacterized protein LOC144730763 [Lampetra planeri]
MSHPHLEARRGRFLCDAGLYLRADELGAAGALRGLAPRAPSPPSPTATTRACPAGAATASVGSARHSGARRPRTRGASAARGGSAPAAPASRSCASPTSRAPAGMGVTQLGSAVMDTRCSACPPDFFSNETSATQTCRPHTRCDRDGRLTTANGTATRDSECGARTLDPARDDERPGAVEVGHMHWIVPLSVAIFFTVIFACCFDCYKRKEPNNRFQANVIQVGNGNTVVHG